MTHTLHHGFPLTWFSHTFHLPLWIFQYIIHHYYSLIVFFEFRFCSIYLIFFVLYLLLTCPRLVFFSLHPIYLFILLHFYLLYICYACWIKLLCCVCLWLWGFITACYASYMHNIFPIWPIYIFHYYCLLLFLCKSISFLNNFIIFNKTLILFSSGCIRITVTG